MSQGGSIAVLVSALCVPRWRGWAAMPLDGSPWFYELGDVKL